jgi:hypothetical protein
MSSYDPVTVANFTASNGAATNAITFPILVHKVVVHAVAAATTQASVLIYNATTASGAVLIELSTDMQYSLVGGAQAQSDFNPPVPFDSDGLSTTIAGSAGVDVSIYYTRA